MEKALDPLWEVYDSRWGDFTARQKAVLLAWIFQGQVDNGGFEQFFFNSSGDQAAETMEGLRLIGAQEYATLLARALLTFPPSLLPGDSDSRNAFLANLAEDAPEIKVLDDVNHQYFELSKSKDLIDDVAARYVQEHLEDFCT